MLKQESKICMVSLLCLKSNGARGIDKFLAYLLGFSKFVEMLILSVQKEEEEWSHGPSWRVDRM